MFYVVHNNDNIYQQGYQKLWSELIIRNYENMFYRVGFIFHDFEATLAELRLVQNGHFLMHVDLCFLYWLKGKSNFWRHVIAFIFYQYSEVYPKPS